MRPDFSRIHNCPNIGCSSSATCLRHDSEHEEVWTCKVCGQLQHLAVETLMEHENKVLYELRRIEGILAGPGGVGNIHPKTVQDVAQLSATSTSPLHFLTLTALELHAKVCASHAVGIEQAVSMDLLGRNMNTPYGTLVQLRLQSAESGLGFASGCECIAAGCNGRNCPVGTFAHSAVFECAIPVFHAFQDLKSVPQSRWPHYAKDMMMRYIGLLYIAFGDEDMDVKGMETELLNATQTVSTSPTNDNVSSGTGRKPASNRGKKKKKGRKTNNKKKRG